MADDFNEVLRNTKTAAADGGLASEQWIKGTKRRAGTHADPPETGTSSTSPHPRATAEGLDMARVKEEIVRDHQVLAEERKRSNATAVRLSEEDAARMAHGVLAYVMQQELGGRQNASKSTERAIFPRPGELHAERATLSPTAKQSIQYVTYDGWGLVSTVHREKAPPGVAAWRASLTVLDSNRDLVGGITSAKGPRIRQLLLRLVRAGLRGEEWVRDETHVPQLDRDATDAPAPVVLFGDQTSGAGEARPAGGQTEGFSLSAFLDDSSPDSD